MSTTALWHWEVALPPEWRLGKIKHLASVTLGKMLQVTDSSDANAPYLRAANVQPDGLLALDDVKEMIFSSGELSQLTLHRGDVVVVEGGQGGYGRAAYINEDLIGWGFQNSIIRLRPRTADGRYLAYYLIAARQRGYVQSICNVVSMPHYPAEKLAGTTIPLPPLAYQYAISDYLDRQTAKTDILIEKQVQLIEMLQERRASVVSSAMNETQSFRRLKFLAEVTLGKMLDAGRSVSADAEMLPYVRAADIRKSGKVNLLGLNQMPFMPSESKRLDLQRDDVLVVEGGAMGRPAYLNNDIYGVSFQKTVNRVRPKSSLASGRFLYHALWLLDQAGYHRAHIDAVSMPHLTAEKLLAVELPWTPLDAQCHLAEQVDEKVDKVETLIDKAERLITLARERRASLITAAVTGQIDVQEMA